MKSFLIYFILALFFLIIESTILYPILPSFLIPDVILIMVFYLGFSNRSTSGALTAFALGYITDVFAGGVMGTSSFTLVFVFAVTSLFAKIVSLNSILIKIGGTIFMSIVKGLLTYILTRFLNQEIPFYIILLPSAFTGIASPFIFNLLKKIEIKTKVAAYYTMEKIEL